jgi:FtsH-binding integral membrane protein
MDYVDRLAGRAPAFNFDALFKFTDLTPPVQKHLQKVYVTLAALLAVAAGGVAFAWAVTVPAWMSVVGFMACVFLLLSTPPDQRNYNVRGNRNARYLLVGGAAFFQGTTLAPLLHAAFALQPQVPLTAFLGTSVIFGCFSAAALMARRRSYLFLGGLLSSAMSIMLVMRLGSWFFGSRQLVYQAELYVGLLVFVGYVLFDTQVIIEKADRGDRDHIKNAFDLFVDFIAIFVRVLVILLQSAQKKEEQQRRKRRD